jgi:hypothetical protein
VDSGDRLEVFRYTMSWPMAVLVFTAMAGIGYAILVFGLWPDLDVTVSSYERMAGAVLGILGGAWFWHVYWNQASFHVVLRAGKRLIVDRDGLRTEWGALIPWRDVRGFSVGYFGAETDDATVSLELPSVLVQEPGKYECPWVRKLNASPSNAVPILNYSTRFQVRRSGQALEMSGEEVCRELARFRSLMQAAPGGGQRIIA